MLEMASITMENSGWSGNQDMGSNHEKAHADQHKFLQDGEPLIETLTDNKADDLSTNLVIDYALKNGYKKSVEEWKKLPRSKQKGSYDLYFGSLFLRTAKAKKKRLDDKKTAPSTRRKIGQELATLQRAGMIIDSSLFYISNTAIYQDMDKDELKKYRKFERTTFERFYNSKTFQELNPQLIRAEIHFDEMGAMHMQTQQEWLHKDKRNRSSYSKRAMVKNLLIKKYGSEKELQNRLDVLCYVHHAFKKVNKSDPVRPGIDNRPDFVYLDFVKKHKNPHLSQSKKENTDTKDGYRKYAYSAAERRTRLTELWRLEQIDTLRQIAEETAKEMNVEYSVDKRYTTDNKHRNREQYLQHQQLKGVNDKLNTDNQKLNSEIDNKNKALTSTNKEFATVNTDVAKKNAELDQAKKEKTEVDSSIRQAYTAITGRLPVDKNGKDLSTRETAEALKQAVTGLKDDTEKQQKRLKDAQSVADTLEASNQEALDSLTDTKKQQQAENKQLQKLRKQRQQREQEAVEAAKQQQQDFQQQFSKNEELINAQTSTLSNLKAQTAAETKKIEQLKRQQQQQQQLHYKAAQYDKIDAAVGKDVPVNATLADYVVSKIALLEVRVKQKVESNKLMQKALARFGKLAGVFNKDRAKEYAENKDTTKQKELTNIVNSKLDQLEQTMSNDKKVEQQHNRQQEDELSL